MITLALFNARAGCLESDGQFDFGKLQGAFVGVANNPPALIGINEAKKWADNGNAGLLGATNALSALLARPYVGELCPREKGALGNALIYDPTVLVLLTWFNHTDYPTYADKLGLAVFAVRGSEERFAVLVEHWSARSYLVRQEQACRIDRYGAGFSLPTIVVGDFNETMSGPLAPRRDWALATPQDRSHKARQLESGEWVARTSAVDHLIGQWSGELGNRATGCGFHAVAELAALTGTPYKEAFAATVNRSSEAGGGQLIDLILTNDPDLYVPGTYQVHLPPDGDSDAFSDHRLVTTGINP